MLLGQSSTVATPKPDPGPMNQVCLSNWHASLASVKLSVERFAPATMYTVIKHISETKVQFILGIRAGHLEELIPLKEEPTLSISQPFTVPPL